MCRWLLKCSAPLVLLFALVFLTGVASISFASVGTAAADHCCDKAADGEFPAGSGECDDPDCRCLSCSASILNEEAFLPASSLEPPAPYRELFRVLAGDYIRAIDYPPEVV